MEHNSRQRYLKILQLDDEDITLEKIRKQYIKLSLIYHPDIHYRNFISKEEAEKKFKELTEAYNYICNEDYNKNNPYTWIILSAESMIDNNESKTLRLQMMYAMFEYYKKLGLFAKFLYRNNYHNYYRDIIKLLVTLTTYKLQYVSLDFIGEDGIPRFFLSEDGYLQTFPEESQVENIIEITNGLDVDIYIPNIDSLVESINNKRNVFDKKNYLNVTIGKSFYVKNIMSNEEKLKILNLYCIEIDEITESNKNKINNLLKRLKF